MATKQGCYYKQSLQAVVWPLTFHLTNYTRRARPAGQGRNLKATFFNGLLHMDTLVWDDQQKVTHLLCTDTGCSLEDLRTVVD